MNLSSERERTRVTAVITPIPKVTKPMQPTDFRPISVTRVLSRSLERFIVRSNIYPAFQHPPPGLVWSLMTSMLSGHQAQPLPHSLPFSTPWAVYYHQTSSFTFFFVRLYKSIWHGASCHTDEQNGAATDSRQHLQLDNWLFEEHHHCTRYAGHCSSLAEVKANVIQGSGLGPVSYLVTAADPYPVTAGNRIFKYADDTFIVVPAANTGLRLQEISYIQQWAEDNNLRLNCSKSKEIVFTTRGTRIKTEQLSPPCPNIERVNSVRVLGVIVNDRLTAADHVNSLLSSCSSLLYALRVLRSHDIPPTSLHDVFRATIVAKLM